MAAQSKLVRVKALKMFKTTTDGSLPIMVHPGDVVEVDRFMAGMVTSALKAEVTEEQLGINKNYTPPAPAPQSDPIGAVLHAIETLTKVMSGGKFAAKGV